MTIQYKLPDNDNREKKFTIDYEGSLDKQQLDTVLNAEGPSLVIAGAGSGKTRTIVYRVARLIESGVSPDSILLVTFTNKAADEMRKRVEGLVNTDAKSVWSGTFHSIANRVLRQRASQLSYGNNFTILDSDDAESLVGAVMDELEIDTKKKCFPKQGRVLEIISMATNTGVSITDVITQMSPYFKEHIATINSIADAYKRRKLTSNTMDFDDLLTNWLRLLTEFPEELAYWSNKFKYILVDEYQDTNFLQAKITDLLASKHRNLMVVGDDAQCIYRWRGASFDNMFGFKERFTDAKEFVLDINYRSTPEIMNLANQSIANNKHQLKKTLIASRNSIGVLPALVPLSDGTQQAEFVAARILELRDAGIPLSKMAVLYRAHSNAMQLELELNKRNILYEVRSGKKFMEQAHIKDAVAYVKVASNPNDELAWKRILMMIPGIGKLTGHKLWEQISITQKPIDVLMGTNFAKGVSTSHVNNLADLLRRFYSDSTAQSPAAIIEMVINSDYKDYLANTHDDAEDRMEDIKELAAYASKFNSTESFLTQIALVAAESGKRNKNGLVVGRADKADVDEEPLILSTIHRAKGLEWKVVFVISACDSCLPSSRSLTTELGKEEERRLFYVAITRTEDQLYICYPMRLGNRGGYELQVPSRFISEVPPELFEKWDVSIEEQSEEAA